MDIALEQIKKIVVFKFGGLGDYAMTLPFFEDLRSLFPRAELSAIIAPTGVELLRQQGIVDKFVISSALYLPNSKSWISAAYLSDGFEMKSKLVPPYDLFVDLTHKFSPAGGLKPFLISKLCKPRHSIGLDYKNRGSFLKIRVSEDRYELVHNIERYSRIIRVLGGRSSFRLGHLSIPQQALAKAAEFYQKAGSEKALRIGIHPGANARDFEARAWPVERFAELIDRIAASENAQFFMTGSTEEERLYKRLIQLSRAKIYRVPACASALEICAYLKGLDYYVTNDTGPMHLAVCLGVPTVGIFGRSDFASYGTYPSSVPFAGVTLDSRMQLQDRRDPRGLKKIRVDEVLAGFSVLKKHVAAQAR